MSVVDIRTIISSSTRRMTTGLLSSEGSKASPPGFPGETPIPSRTYSSSERGTTRRRLGEADFSERRLFQLAAVALACRGCLEYRARDLGFGQCEARIRDLVEGFPRLAAIIEPLLTVRRVMRQQLATLHKLLLNAVRVDPVCRRFMTVPGVGPIVALTYRASVDQPHRFIHSRAVGAHVGLTPKRLSRERSIMTAVSPNVETPCCARCSTKPRSRC